MSDVEPRPGRARADAEASVADALAQIEMLRKKHASSRPPAAGPAPTPITTANPTHDAGNERGNAPTPLSNAEEARALRELEQTRVFRQWQGRDLSIAGLVGKTRREADDVHRRLGSLVGVWQSLVPPAIAAHVEVTAMRGGVVHVAADSSAVAFELDRRLREGLLAELRRAFRGTLSRVKVTVGSGRS